MTKTILGLRGRPNCGKTTTIGIVRDELAALGTSLHTNNRRGAKEIVEVILIAGVRVGLISSGDKPDTLKRQLGSMLSFECSVVVCAARLSRSNKPEHDTIDVVEHFSEANRFRVRWIDKHGVDKGQEASNRGYAETIVQHVRDAITLA